MGTLDRLTELLHLEIGERMPHEIPNFGRDRLATVFARLDFNIGAEIGVEHGVYSEVLCKANPQLQLLCVDPWLAYPGYRDHTDQEELDDCYRETVDRLSPYNVSIVKLPSMEAADLVPDGSLDFVYIDGNHELPWVINDMIVWSRKVRSGGIVAGHDYYESILRDSRNHVVPAVLCYTRAYRIKPWFLLGRRGEEGRDIMRSWMWVKR